MRGPQGGSSCFLRPIQCQHKSVPNNQAGSAPAELWRVCQLLAPQWLMLPSWAMLPEGCQLMQSGGLSAGALLVTSCLAGQRGGKAKGGDIAALFRKGHIAAFGVDLGRLLRSISMHCVSWCHDCCNVETAWVPQTACRELNAAMCNQASTEGPIGCHHVGSNKPAGRRPCA